MTDTHAAYITQAIALDGWAVCDDFLDAADTADLASQVERHLAAGDFHAAGVGTKGAFTRDSAVRRDAVFFIDPGTGGPAQGRYAASMEALRCAINNGLFMGLLDLEVHFAVYEPGDYYRTHLDAFRGASRRILSCIVYLNQEWSSDDGGALRLYHGRPDASPWTDIEPKGGRLVCFAAERFHHEVLVTSRRRFSLTGWFNRRA